MSARPLTVAMVAAMPYLMAKASVIRVHHIVTALTTRYPDMRVKVFAYQGTDPGPPQPQVDLHLAGGFDRDKARYYSWRNKLATDWKLIRELVRRRDDFDLIHCHTIEGLFIAQSFRLLARRRTPICIDVHGPVVAEMVHYGLIPDWKPVVAGVSAIEKAMLCSVQQVFVSNEGLRDLLAARVGSDKVRVVYDYVKLDSFSAERIDAVQIAAIRARFQPRGERLITYLGMFKDYQGVDYLIRAFAQLAPRNPGVQLALVGDGPCRAQYQTLIREYGLQDRVVMPGLIPHADVPNWLAVSDLVVSPRIDNHITKAGFVSQMPEYMASGRMIVSTWVSGCRYLLRDGAGILVAPNDVDALASGVEKALALDDAARAPYIAAARRNVEQFTWQNGIADVHDSYRRLVT